MNPPLLEAALLYVKRGWKIIPATPTKQPATRHGVKDATSDVPTIRRWFDTDNLVNVAVALGRASNLAVLDIDAYKPDCGWPTLEIEHGRPDTFTVQTPRLGTHFYFEIPRGMEVRSRTAFARHVELRSNGLYVLAPPSRTADGEYTVINSSDPILIPEWVTGRFSKRNATDRGSDLSVALVPDLSVALSSLPAELRLAHRCLPEVPHQNHYRLFRLARELLTLKANERSKRLAFEYWYRETEKLKLLREGLTFTHYWTEFLDLARYANVPVGGDNPVKRAWRISQCKPFPKEAALFRNPWVKKVVALCWELETNANGKEWFLACSTLAASLGIKKFTAARYLNELIQAGVLEIVKSHTVSKARRFRFKPSPVPPPP